MPKDKSKNNEKEFLIGTSEGTVRQFSLNDSEVVSLKDKFRKNK